MKRLIALVFTCLLMLLPAMASCEVLSETKKDIVPFMETAIINQDSISVTGRAVVVLEPDYADLYLGTDTYHANLSDAILEYEGKINSLTAAMKEYNIPEEDIQIEPYTVTIIYATSTETATSAPRIRGYRLVNNIIVRTKDVSHVGAAIDKASSSGSDRCDKVVFGSSVAESAYDEALDLAIQEAYRKATAMAKSANATVGKVLNMTENGGSYRGIRLKKNANETPDPAKTEVIFESLEFTASVTVAYELK